MKGSGLELDCVPCCSSGSHEAEVIAAGVLDKVISLVVEVVDKDMENILVCHPLDIFIFFI